MGAPPPEAPCKGLLCHSTGRKKGFQTRLQEWQRQLFSLSRLIFCFSNWDNLGLLTVSPQADEPVCHAPHRIQDTPKDTPHSPSFSISHLLPTLPSPRGGGKQGEHLGGRSKGRREWFYGLMVSQGHAPATPRGCSGAGGWRELLVLPQTKLWELPPLWEMLSLLPPFCWRDVYQVNPKSVVPQSVSGTLGGSGS